MCYLTSALESKPLIFAFWGGNNFGFTHDTHTVKKRNYEGYFKDQIQLLVINITQFCQGVSIVLWASCMLPIMLCTTLFSTMLNLYLSCFHDNLWHQAVHPQRSAAWLATSNWMYERKDCSTQFNAIFSHLKQWYCSRSLFALYNQVTLVQCQ